MKILSLVHHLCHFIMILSNHLGQENISSTFLELQNICEKPLSDTRKHNLVSILTQLNFRETMQNMIMYWKPQYEVLIRDTALVITNAISSFKDVRCQ